MPTDEYLPIIRTHIRRVNLDFPHERFGLGDKLILSHVVRGLAEFFRSYHPSRKIKMSEAFLRAVKYEMEQYGYKARKN